MEEYTQWNERLHRLFLLPGTFGEAQSALRISERAQAILLHQNSKSGTMVTLRAYYAVKRDGCFT